MSDEHASRKEKGVVSIEEAQACFADVYDGDYLFAELLARNELCDAILFLYAQLAYDPPTPEPRRSTFRNERGEVSEVSRSGRRDPTGITSFDFSDIVVIVRNGRVEGFTGS